jgi:putative membrane protein
MRRIAIITAFTLISGVALAQSTSEKLGVNAVLGIAPTTQDFVTEAARSGHFEIQSSQLALERGDQMSKTFAQQIITDHEKANTELKGLVQSKNIKVTIPDGVSSSQQSMLDKLKTLQGADFDRRYRDDQYSAHKDAVSLFQRYAKGGDNTDLKQWAEQTTPVLQRHLKMAEDLDARAQK